LFFKNDPLFQEDFNNLSSRVSASEEYLKQIIGAEFDEYSKGEWISLVRDRFRDMGGVV